MSCLCCSGAADVGALCRRCSLEIAPCEGLIPDHVRSTVEATDAEAWMVDGFGVAHPIADKTAIGRNHEGELVVLASSVSREHAEVRRADDGWHVRDLGSRNGTFVDGVRVQGRGKLGGRAVVKVGDVALWFLADIEHEPLPPPSMTTASAGNALVRYQLATSTVELCVVGSSAIDAGGALLSRANPSAPWQERSLAPLEYQLLRALCARSVAETGSPSNVRGCVQTKQLARDLPFQSRFANEENVRQVVRRLRAVLDELGQGNVLAVAPGRGYYIACPVTISSGR
jgi:hypothetical protein